LLQRKILQVRSRNEGGGEEGRASSHKLNITDGLIDRIILVVTPSTILLVSMSRHRTICLYESHCNIVRNVVNIYRHNFFVEIFTYRQSNYVDNCL
jgi:hypothetical protein